MTRTLLTTLILLLGSLVGVGVAATWLVRSDQATLVEQFGLERHGQLLEATRTVADAVDEIADDLRFASELVSQPGAPDAHRRELRALLEVVGKYKAVAVFSGTGEEQVRLVDRRAAQVLDDAVTLERLQATVREALARKDDYLISRPVAPGSWVRVFARAWPGDEETPAGAIAVLVDTEPSFAPLRLLTADADSRRLVLAEGNQPTPTSDKLLVDLVKNAERGSLRRAPRFAEVLRRVHSGEGGTVRVDEEEAQALGLGEADAVVSYAPIQVRGGERWDVVVVASTRMLRNQQRMLVWRLSLAAALVVLFLCAFAVYVGLASRRAAALRASQQHAQHLARLHEQTQKILDHIPTGVLALDAQGRILTLNETLRSRLPAHAQGSPLAAVFPSAVVPRLEQLIASASQENDLRSLLGEPLALFKEDGVYNVYAVPLRSQDAGPQMLLVLEDLSALRNLEGQLVQAEKLATVGVLAAGIAHEIGTPLGVVRGHAEYLQTKLGAGAVQEVALRTIVEQIDRVSRTLRQLLDFSRPQPVRVRSTDLGSRLQSLRELLTLESQRRGVQLALVVPDGLPPLSADPDQLQQVLVNLALNAISACSAGGRVEVRAAAGTASEVELSVEDNGCGIAPEHLHQVFDPFFTTKKRGQGTGLGLTVVASIVRSHGGRVELHSEAGKGTCVVVHWPVARPGLESRHAV